MRRRDLLSYAAAGAAAPSLGATVARAEAQPDLNRLWGQFLQEQLQRKPQEATALGLDKAEAWTIAHEPIRVLDDEPLQPAA